MTGDNDLAQEDTLTLLNFSDTSADVTMDQDVTDVDVSEETDHALSEGLLSAGKYNLHALHGKRHILIASALLFLLTTSGIIFGFVPLSIVLVDQGVYFDLCDSSNSSTSSHSVESSGSHESCGAQLLRLNLLFTLGVLLMKFSSFAMGISLDKLGPKVIAMAGSVIASTGFLLFAFSSPSRAYYLPGFLLFAFGSQAVTITMFNFANLYPKHEGLVTGVMVGAFNLSSLGFAYLNFLYFNYNVSVRLFFLCLSVPSLVTLIMALFLWPMKSIQRVRPLRHGEDEHITVNDSVQHRYSSSYYNESVWYQLKCLGYWLVTFVVAYYSLRLNFFVATFQAQFGNMHGGNVNTYATIYSWTVPISGALGVPFTGTLIDKLGLPLSALALSAFHTVFGIFSLITYMPAQIGTFFSLYLSYNLLYTLFPAVIGTLFGIESLNMQSLLACLLTFVTSC